MHTRISAIDENSLSDAKKIINESGLVAFPTETVYGLGANAFDDRAVKKIFEVKGRPMDNPLIVHVHSGYDISSLVDYIPEYSYKLAKTFLPGPLTMVYKRKAKVSAFVSCGLDTLAVRVPSHIGAQQFLECVDLPVAAPSANVSKHISPVTAQHVLADLDGKIPLILDGGKCAGGIESTVLDCTSDTPKILRSGLITREMIADVAGECEMYIREAGEAPKSPGMKYRHYSPRCACRLFMYEERFEAMDEYTKKRGMGVNAYIMCDDACAEELGAEHVLCLGKSETEIASNLYDKLREGERIADLIIAVAPRKQDGVMAGVMNRLTKACGGEE